MRSVTDLCFVAFVLMSSIMVGMYSVSQSGALWQDSPRYANAALMIHDWVLSGQWSAPYEFAKEFYSKYPGFSVPYHPPAYPAALAVFMLVFGQDYWVVRLFSALCLSVAVLATSGIARQLGARRVSAYLTGVTLLSIPEVVHWSRDTMSEVPALMLILVASYCFLKWLESTSVQHCLLAVLFAELAFLSRVTTSGVLLGLFLFALSTGHWRTVFCRSSVCCWGAYLCINFCWILFVRQFSKYELVENAAANRVAFLEPWHLAYYPIKSWDMLGPVVFCLVVVGLFLFVRNCARRQLSKIEVFAFCWVFGFFVFQLCLCVNEQRYFFFALVGFALLVGNLISFIKLRRTRYRGAVTLAICCLVSCAMSVMKTPPGIVGYAAVASRISNEEVGGNVLAACVADQDLITRLLFNDVERRFRVLRGDRVLALRLPGYAGVKTQVLAHTREDVLKLLELGRVRYVVTFTAEANAGNRFREEMRLAHDAMVSSSNCFTLLQQYDFEEQNGREAVTRGVVWLWRYTGVLPDGPSELSIPVPTAGFELKQAK